MIKFTRLLFILILVTNCRSQQSGNAVVYSKSNPKIWFIVNDGVMGGLSKGYVNAEQTQTLVFEGHVSLDNNGGFTMVSSNVGSYEVSENSKLKILLKGDGKKYQFRLKRKSKDYWFYVFDFKTSGEEEWLELNLSDMYPSFMGQKMNDDNFNHKSFEQVSFLISNQVEEDFRLEVKEIRIVN